MASVERRGDRFRVRWRYGGTRDGAWQSITTLDEGEAREIDKMLVDAGHLMTKADVLAKLDVHPVGGLTTAAWVEDYIDGLTGISESTQATYLSAWRHHIAGLPIGAVPLAALTRDDVRAWIKAHDGVPPKSIANYRSLLSAALTEAVMSGHLASNPCAGLRLPRGDSHTTRNAGRTFLTPAQVEKLAESLPARWQFIPRVLARTGLRWGELVALRVEDIDLTANTLTVARARKRGRNGPYDGPPKTRRSRRTIALDAVTVDALRPLVEGRPAADRLIVTEAGHALPHTTFIEAWRVACATAGIAARVHDLRHTHAAWLISAGVPLPAIQRRLGHESITTTIDIYGHLLPEVDDQIVAALNRAGRGRTRDLPDCA